MTCDLHRLLDERRRAGALSLWLVAVTWSAALRVSGASGRPLPETWPAVAAEWCDPDALQFTAAALWKEVTRDD